ncbi:TIGR01777 family oxidoreductase [Solitalea sp. MAHUQ-68]|uniref:TIGR01777 family oxidoreductase n=1 Tax=Solitalea agri TaxID=2953739 RepID=A0A9X2JED4_9SPHI|nr:TIGR01777 family oxidoreductase [Solitalea agri]MCO4293845.1 TIGR01777 family oxidoreductase [Solitalea agri]
MKNILITGGSGLIGSVLTEQLILKGYKVAWLTHSDLNKNSAVQLFKWDLANGEIDSNAIDFADSIINMAGAGIADKHWTSTQKQKIIDSRVKGIQLLTQAINNSNKPIGSFISASAIGYYGNRGEKILTEDESPSTDFLGECCVAWENAVDLIERLGIRTVKLRTGIVLSNNGGALPKMVKPIKMGMGVTLGSGNQWMSWIHISDMCRMYIHALENNNLTGVFNATSPQPVTYSQFTNAVANQLNRPVWLPNIPEFAMKIMLGEMSHLVLDSTRCSSAAIEKTGFLFQFRELSAALNELLPKQNKN